MDWNRINIWTATLYTLIHSIHLSKQISFGNLTTLDKSVLGAAGWITPICSYNSVLAPFLFKKEKIKFRRDPNVHFDEISAQLIKMLIQDLVVIFDEMMNESIQSRGKTVPNYPQPKIEFLGKSLNAKYLWAMNGCLELVAVRNSISHGDGAWNVKSVNVVKPFMVPIPAVGDKIIIGFPALFHYRKAIRTFLNETKL